MLTRKIKKVNEEEKPKRLKRPKGKHIDALMWSSKIIVNLRTSFEEENKRLFLLGKIIK